MTGKDGALPSKTGYLIYVTEDTSIVNGAVAFVTSHGQMPYSTSGESVSSYMKTRIGGSAPSRMLSNLL